MEKEAIKIIEKVTQLYRQYGIKSVTMDDVARELGISKKTLYEHFEDKEDLVSKVVEYALDERRSSLNEINTMNLNAIEELFHYHKFQTDLLKQYSPPIEYDLKKYYPELFKKILEIKREYMYKIVLNNLKKGKKQGFYRKDLDEEIISRLFVFRMEGLQSNEFFTIEQLSSPVFFRELFNYHIRGIANEKGIETLEHHIKQKKQVVNH